MTSDNQQLSYPPEHPEDLLEAYALGALEAAERDDFEAHLDSCAHCSGVLAELAGTRELLAQSVPQIAAPAHLQSQVMAAVDELPPVFAPQREEREAVAPEPAPADASARFTFSSFAMPLAATLVIGLLSASLIMNVITTNRLNSLEQERQETNARLIELERGHAAASAGLSQLAAGRAAHQFGIAAGYGNQLPDGPALYPAPHAAAHRWPQRLGRNIAGDRRRTEGNPDAG